MIELPSNEKLMESRVKLLRKIDDAPDLDTARPLIEQLDQLDEMIEQVKQRRVGVLEVPAIKAKPAPTEELVPQPKPINYQRKGVDVCKSCSSVGSGSRPLIVFKKITAAGDSANIEEIYAHRECVGILMVVHARSLFQVKLTLSGDRT